MFTFAVNSRAATSSRLL